MAASGFFQPGQHERRPDGRRGRAGNQLAGLAISGATTYNTPINGTEYSTASPGPIPDTLNLARQDLVGLRFRPPRRMAIAGYTGIIYSNASETFNGTVWSAGNSIQNTRSQTRRRRQHPLRLLRRRI